MHAFMKMGPCCVVMVTMDEQNNGIRNKHKLKGCACSVEAADGA